MAHAHDAVQLRLWGCGFTVDGVSGAGGQIYGGVSNVTVKNSAFNTACRSPARTATSSLTGTRTTTSTRPAGTPASVSRVPGMTVRTRRWSAATPMARSLAGGRVRVPGQPSSVCEWRAYRQSHGRAPVRGSGRSGRRLRGRCARQLLRLQAAARRYGQALRHTMAARARSCGRTTLSTRRGRGIELYADEGSSSVITRSATTPPDACSTHVREDPGDAQSRRSPVVGTQVYDNVATVDATDSMGSATITTRTGRVCSSADR